MQSGLSCLEEFKLGESLVTEEIFLNKAEIPNIPSVVSRIIQMASEENFTANKMAAEIQKDPVLVTRILKIANSSYYATQTEVTTISRAISVLGTSVIQSVALSAAIFNKLSKKDNNRTFDIEAFWKRSLLSAVACRLLAQKKGYPIPEEAFIVGLLHDIGMLAMAKAQADYEEVCEKNNSSMRARKSTDMEDDEFKTNHSKVGYLFAKNGCLPDFIQEAILFHHSPEEYNGKSKQVRLMIVFTCLSDILLNIFDSNKKSSAIFKFKTMARSLGNFDEKESEDILYSAGKELSESGSCFDVSIGSQKSYQEILQEANNELGKINLKFQIMNNKLKNRDIEISRINEKLKKEIIERKKVEEEVKHLAYHDTLTNLSNRMSFGERLSQELGRVKRNNGRLALMFLDLDHFKSINDTLGHDVGDLLLKEVAERLKRCVRTCDTISRLGGDEFTLLLPDIKHASDASNVANRVLNCLKKPFNMLSNQLYVTFSIGIAFYPNDGITSEALMKNADTAMYRAKERGRNNYKFYTAEMNAKVVEFMDIEAKLRKAIDNNELFLEYQPLIDLNTGEMSGLEALLRWKNSDLGLVPTPKFISVAEDTGLIIPIGEWVLKTACKQSRIWNDIIDKPVHVSVNLSARQFSQHHLFEHIENLIKNTGVDPRYLDLEITESYIMKDADTAINILHSLRKLGIKLSLDDFGTGYSSLSYLKRLPINTVKMDRAFISNIVHCREDVAIASAIITMSHGLNLKVVAEGVETTEQLELLRSLHCDIVQGYIFSKSLHPGKVLQILKSKKRFNFS